MLTLTVDWEKQTEEMILVTYQGDDGDGDIAFIVGKPALDNADTERRALELAVSAARGAITGRGRPLFRVIATEAPPSLRAIWGQPGHALVEILSTDPAHPDLSAIVAAAHRLVEAKLDPNADTSS